MKKNIIQTTLIIGMTISSMEGVLWLSSEAPPVKAAENVIPLNQSNATLFTSMKTDALYVNITSPLKAWKQSISGKANPGTKIQLFIDGQSIVTKYAGDDTIWTVKGLYLREGQKIKIKATLGAEMLETEEYVVGMGAPIFINDLNNNSTKVTGYGSEGSRVSVKTSSGSEIGFATASTGGLFEITIPKQPAGSKLLISQARAGEESEATEVEVVEAKDILAPVITSGFYKGSTKISGKATPKSIVRMHITRETGGGASNTISYSVSTNDSGNWELSVQELKVGDVVDTSSSLGGVSASNESITVAPDQVSNVNRVTSNSTKVIGKGTPGATAQVWVKEVGMLTQVGTQLIGSDGTFQVTIPKQAGGTKLYVYQEENKTLSNHVEVNVVQGLDKPTNINSLDNNSTKVTGSGAAGAIISVKANGKEIANGLVANDGRFEVAIPKQTIGTKLFISQVTYGDESEAVIVSVDGQLLAPTILDYYMGSAYIRGTVPAGAVKVILTINDQVVRIGNVDSNGNYSVYVNDLEALKHVGVSFGIAAQDVNNGLSEVTRGEVKEFPAPQVAVYKVGQTYITGTAAEGTSRIAVHDEAGVLYRVGQVNENGTFRIYVSGVEAFQRVGSNFVVKATNASGTKITETKGTVLPK
ncbi:hypothetical protein HCA69_06685 [Listeria grandensis]|uniref:Bacterial Ig domain-containing protein n=1 Tax=Listeria grandensis TaxID=1494963 RepID=A0A7X0Y443_9LIST|nr:Ig-like domain-containing protein [Listeria grandensis]MBC1936047.1 hypothetical protein [Listeria grandensis]